MFKPPHTSRNDHRIGGRALPLPSFGLEVGIRIEPLFVFLPATHPQPLHLNLIVAGAPTPRDMPIDDGTRPLGDGVRKEASIRFAYLCCLLRQSAGAFHARRHALARLRDALCPYVATLRSAAVNRCPVRNGEARGNDGGLLEGRLKIKLLRIVHGPCGSFQFRRRGQDSLAERRRGHPCEEGCHLDGGAGRTDETFR
jgi:hypothetical protein